MINVRSRREIELMRSANRIVSTVLRTLRSKVQPGVRTIELDRLAESIIRDQGGKPAFKGYRGFPANICTSINDEVVHGIPSERTLDEGDIVSIDVGVEHLGYCGDAAITVGVGKISADAARLIAVTEKALEEGIRAARAGNHISDISIAIQRTAESEGFSVVRIFVGHGIGVAIHEEPEVPNFGRSGTGPLLTSGMALAIEPMINCGSHEVEVLDDGWTAVTKDRKLSAHFEHTIVITDSKAEVLTR